MAILVKRFEELDKNELYRLLQLRFNIFVIEQNSIYPDIDDLDQKAIHLMERSGKNLIAYARIYKEENYYHIGRVAVKKDYRGQEKGRKLMNKALDIIHKKKEKADVKISAQHGLVNYYQSFGFTVCSKPYDDGGILHVDMVKQAFEKQN